MGGLPFFLLSPPEYGLDPILQKKRQRYAKAFPGCFGQYADAAKQMAPNVPVALYGHSMGGNIIINALLRGASGYACAVLEAPWLGLLKEPNALTVCIARFLGWISPKPTTQNKLNPNALTSDPERAKVYVDDALYHGTISFRMFTGIKNGCAFAIANAAKTPIPTFLAIAANDKVLCNDAILRFADNAGDALTVKEYDSRHAIHNDVKHEELFRDVVAFLDKYCVAV